MVERALRQVGVAQRAWQGHSMSWCACACVCGMGGLSCACC